MDIVKTIVIVIQLLLGLGLIAVITMQSGKSAGLAGALGGGSETFFGKGKAKNLDAKLARATKWIAGGFVLLTFVLTLL